MVTTSMLFDKISRTDKRPNLFGETTFAFLNRSGSRYFGSVRELIEEWLTHVPTAARRELVGSMRKDDAEFSSSFWELYLHEAYRRSGYTVEIHPELAHTRNRPDFRISTTTERFYLEAVSVGRSREEVAAENRLEAVQRVLQELTIQVFTLAFTHYAIGPRPLATTNLRKHLAAWLSTLDPDDVMQAIEASTSVGFDQLPSTRWIHDGWEIEFHAIPRKPEAQELKRSSVGVWGPGEATIVDNASGIRRVLDHKHGRYGPLDAPLVIAVQSNTIYPTQDYEVEQALYGIASRRPQESAEHPNDLFEEGFWLSRRGWRRSETPQVITVSGLSPWTVTTCVPRLWQTLKPGVGGPVQPTWLARMVIDTEARAVLRAPPAIHLGLPHDWPGVQADFS